MPLSDAANKVATRSIRIWIHYWRKDLWRFCRLSGGGTRPAMRQSRSSYMYSIEFRSRDLADYSHLRIWCSSKSSWLDWDYRISEGIPYLFHVQVSHDNPRCHSYIAEPLRFYTEAHTISCTCMKDSSQNNHTALPKFLLTMLDEW